MPRGGLIGRPDKLTIKGAKGNVVWDLEVYKKFIADDKPPPDTVNPSLWRNRPAQHALRPVQGLSMVCTMCAAYDLSNVTFVQGKTGWIVGDPLISAGDGQGGLRPSESILGKKPIIAVIYSHSHVDHYGGVRGLVSDADVKSGKVKIIAPENFTEHAVAENVIAGHAHVSPRHLHVRRAPATRRHGRCERRSRSDDLGGRSRSDRAERYHQEDG